MAKTIGKSFKNTNAAPKKQNNKDANTNAASKEQK